MSECPHDDLEVCKEITALVMSGIDTSQPHYHIVNEDGIYLETETVGWYHDDAWLLGFESEELGAEVVKCTEDIIDVCLKRKEEDNE